MAKAHITSKDKKTSMRLLILNKIEILNQCPPEHLIRSYAEFSRQSLTHNNVRLNLSQLKKVVNLIPKVNWK